jgi:hypothetical protein
VRQCIVESHIEAGDENEFHNGVSAMSRELDDWFEAITDWLAALTDHNFVQLGSKQLSVSELGFSAWSGDEHGRRHTMCGLNLTIVPRQSEAVTADQLRTCMYLGAKEPQASDRMAVDSGRAVARLRRPVSTAVLDAGTAAELALTAMLEPHIYPSGDAIREALFDRYRTLGDLKKLALKLIREKVPEGLEEDLIAPRNLAVHKADKPVTRQTAKKAILKAIEVVSTAHPIPDVLGV